MSSYLSVRTSKREGVQAKLKRLAKKPAAKMTIPLAMKLMPKWWQLLEGEWSVLMPFVPTEELLEAIHSEELLDLQRLYHIHRLVERQIRPAWMRVTVERILDETHRMLAWRYASRCLISYFMVATAGDLEQVRTQALQVENCL